MKFFCLCLSITVTVMFTGRRITTLKRHCLNSCLLSIAESNSNLCSNRKSIHCCYITWTNSTVIYVGLYQCWLNQFGIRLVLANDDQQQHNNKVSIHRARQNLLQFRISLSLCPQKTQPLFLYIPHKKPSFKPINDHFIVADIC